MNDIVLTRRATLAGMAAVGLIAAAPGTKTGKTVKTKYGRVAGLTRNGVEVYLGMPYGASTGGARRFLPPIEPDPWSGVRDATKFGQRSPQAPPPTYMDATIGNYMAGGRSKELAAMGEPMGEDCLVLNVLTPAADARKRPVLVYFHGGGFGGGSGSTMSVSDRLVHEEDVVLVTVNHRLGALGFMYLGDLSEKYAVGNPGMLDLVASLKWVRDNIGAFGGDPAKVTIFGESGGAAKVGLLLAMPEAKGLFRAAILESGLVPDPQPRAAATAVTQTSLKTLGIDPKDVEKLHELPVDELMKINGNPFGPVADDRVYKAGLWNSAPATAASVPIIIGHCATELTVFTGVIDSSTMKLDNTTLVPKVAEYLELGEAAVAPVVTAYRAACPGEDAVWTFFRILTDATFGRGMIDMAERKAAQQPPVYFYRFEYDTQLPPGLRAFHTAELPLAGRNVLQPRAEGLSRQVAGAWAAFARTGNPNHPGMPKWQPFKLPSRDLMIFNETSRAIPDPQVAARAVLQSVLGSKAVPIFRMPKKS